MDGRKTMQSEDEIESTGRNESQQDRIIATAVVK